MKKTLVSALTTALVVGAASTTFAAANPFSDVPADHWAYDAVSSSALTVSSKAMATRRSVATRTSRVMRWLR